MLFGRLHLNLVRVQILLLVIGTRQRIVEETDAKDDALSDDDEVIKPRLEGPSNDALAKFTDFSK